MQFKLTGKYLELASIRGNQPHTGIDLGMPENTPLRSVTDGVIDKILHNDKIGNGVVIEGQDGNHYIYGHLNEVDVTPGQRVFEGQQIGLSGNTGNSTGPHLHFGMQDGQGNFIDPTPLAEKVDAMSGGNWFIEKWNALGDYVIGKEADLIGHPIQNFLHDIALSCWNWFIVNLPDIIGYTAIGAGILIILSAMAGKGIVKPIGWFFGAFILAACILGGV
jgi:Peptidase family M23